MRNLTDESPFTAKLNTKILAGCLALVALTSHAEAGPPRVVTTGHQSSGGRAVAYPWQFQNGDGTSQDTAIETAEKIMQKAGYAAIPEDAARNAWSSQGDMAFGRSPSKQALETFGKAVHADKVIYGSISWHTRSIWVDTGPKTVSTATVDAYVFDVASEKTIYKKKGITGRSDEKENAYKVVADILITPLVTVVSGGPATPREQRAVQIALSRAYHSWVKSSNPNNSGQ